MTPSNQLQGIPEGVEVIDYLPAGPDDFELVRYFDETLIVKGGRPNVAISIRVKPAVGYCFIEGRLLSQADIRSLNVVTLQTYCATKILPPTVITATIKFSVENAIDQAAVEQALEGLRQLRGFNSLEKA